MDSMLMKKGNNIKLYVIWFPSPTTRPVIGPQSQINEEKACSMPSVCIDQPNIESQTKAKAS